MESAHGYDLNVPLTGFPPFHVSLPQFLTLLRDNTSHTNYLCLNLGFSVYFKVNPNWAESKKSLAHSRILDFSLWKLPDRQLFYGANKKYDNNNTNNINS